VIKEACLSLPVNEDHIDETYKAEAILFGLGFTAEDMDKDPAELSGGYQIRLNLTKVLVSEPNLLLLDEPRLSRHHLGPLAHPVPARLEERAHHHHP